MNGLEKVVSYVASIAFAFATAEVAGVVPADAFALIPSDIMGWLSPAVIAVTVVMGIASGGRFRPSDFEDWELGFVILSIFAVFGQYVLETESILEGTALEASAWVVFLFVGVAYGLVNRGGD